MDEYTSKRDDSSNDICVDNILADKEKYSTRVCPVCKKEFYVADPGSWVYKIICRNQTNYMCSWTCLRKYERSHPVKNRRTIYS